MAMQDSYCQTVPLVTVPINDIQSCLEAFDELDSCTHYASMRDSLIQGLSLAVDERDLLLQQKDADYSLLFSSKADVMAQYELKQNQFSLSQQNFKLLNKKKNKQIAGSVIGSFFAGVGVGLLVAFLK